MRLFILVLPVLLFLAGCTHIISDRSRDRADRSVTFRELRQNPDLFLGRFILVGGVVTGTGEAPEGLRLEVVAYPLDSEEMPDTSAEAEGQFLVVLPLAAGYASFTPGMVVTMAGEVIGKEVRRREKAENRYPVLVVKELHIIGAPGQQQTYEGY